MNTEVAACCPSPDLSPFTARPYDAPLGILAAAGYDTLMSLSHVLIKQALRSGLQIMARPVAFRS